MDCSVATKNISGSASRLTQSVDVKAGSSTTDGTGFQTPLSTQLKTEMNIDFSIGFDNLQEVTKFQV